MALTARVDDTVDTIGGVSATNATNIVRIEAPSNSASGVGANTSYERGNAIGTRFLLIAGEPLNEPIAWHGPIVMNTKKELNQAMVDLSTGNFIRK
jgi:redox-sensitive bicupin YhaK (pirin superfamily)